MMSTPADGADANLLDLCHYHHHCVHDGGYRIELRKDGLPLFYRPDGGMIPDVPPQPMAPNWGYAPIDRLHQPLRPKKNASAGNA
jgi:hypothetical protein